MDVFPDKGEMFRCGNAASPGPKDKGQTDSDRGEKKMQVGCILSQFSILLGRTEGRRGGAPTLAPHYLWTSAGNGGKAIDSLTLFAPAAPSPSPSPDSSDSKSESMTLENGKPEAQKTPENGENVAIAIHEKHKFISPHLGQLKLGN